MKYRIALDPDLKIDAAELIAAWNSNQETRALGEAQPVKEQIRQFIDPIEMGMMIVGPIGTGLLTNGLYDLIKTQVKKKIKIYIEKDQNGDYILVVELIEE